MRTAQFLVIRALGAADRPAGDLRRAQEFAVRARDDRRAWRGDTAEAVDWACAAAFAAGDYRRAVGLGTVKGQATPEEAASPAVRRHVAAAKAGLGALDAPPDTHGMAENDKQSLHALHAMTSGGDPSPHWRAALAAARDDSERVTALAGLAGAGGRDLTGLDEIEAQFPDVAAHVRDLADAAAGDYNSAIARLRGPARTSPTAAMTLADAYARAGRPDDAVAALQEAAERFSDPDMALSGVKLLYRTGPDRRGRRRPPRRRPGRLGAYVRTAADRAAARSTAALVYDDARRTVLVEDYEQDAERRDAEAQVLAGLAALLLAVPDPAVEPDDPVGSDWGRGWPRPGPPPHAAGRCGPTTRR